MILSAASTSSLTIPSPSSMLIRVPISPRLGPLIPLTWVHERRERERESPNRHQHTKPETDRDRHVQSELIFKALHQNYVVANTYLVKLVWYDWLHIAARYVNLSTIIIEIDASHSIQNGSHNTSLSSILALLEEGKKNNTQS